MISFRKKIVLAGCCFVLCLTAELAAQFPGFDFNSRSKRSGDTPTKVKAESMDIDINKNQVTLIGNVDVEDQDMGIRCRKMIIYFVDKKEDESGKKGAAVKEDKNSGKKDAAVKEDKNSGKKDTKKKSREDDGAANRKVDRIECIGDVEITRSTGEGREKQIQKAFAEKAVYRMQDNMIALTGNPVVSSGRNSLRGEFITMDTKTGRISVLRPDSRIIGGFKGLTPEKDKKAPAGSGKSEKD